MICYDHLLMAKQTTPRDPSRSGGFFCDPSSVAGWGTGAHFDAVYRESRTRSLSPDQPTKSRGDKELSGQKGSGADEEDKRAPKLSR